MPMVSKMAVSNGNATSAARDSGTDQIAYGIDIHYIQGIYLICNAHHANFSSHG